MFAPTFFVHPLKSGKPTVISYFDFNKGKDQFVVFEWDGEGWVRRPARLLETGICGGHQPYGLHRSLKTPPAYCTMRGPLARRQCVGDGSARAARRALP